MKAICPSCGNAAELPDRALGKKARCAKCQNPFTVQAATSQPPLVVEGVASPMVRKCPSCGASLPPGDLSRCSYCGVNLATPAPAAPKGAVTSAAGFQTETVKGRPPGIPDYTRAEKAYEELDRVRDSIGKVVDDLLAAARFRPVDPAFLEKTLQPLTNCATVLCEELGAAGGNLTLVIPSPSSPKYTNADGMMSLESIDAFFKDYFPIIELCKPSGIGALHVHREAIRIDHERGGKSPFEEYIRSNMSIRWLVFTFALTLPILFIPDEPGEHPMPLVGRLFFMVFWIGLAWLIGLLIAHVSRCPNCLRYWARKKVGAIELGRYQSFETVKDMRVSTIRDASGQMIGTSETPVAYDVLRTTTVYQDHYVCIHCGFAWVSATKTKTT